MAGPAFRGHEVQLDVEPPPLPCGHLDHSTVGQDVPALSQRKLYVRPVYPLIVPINVHLPLVEANIMGIVALRKINPPANPLAPNRATEAIVYPAWMVP